MGTTRWLAVMMVSVGVVASVSEPARAQDEPPTPPAERQSTLPIFPPAEGAEGVPADNDCGFLSGATSYDFQLRGDDEHGWSTRWSTSSLNLSGAWHNSPDGLVWDDFVFPAGFREAAPPIEDLVILDRDGPFVSLLIDRTEFPEEGPAEGIRSMCTIDLFWPEEQFDFLLGTTLRDAPPLVDELGGETTDTDVRAWGSTTEPPGTPVELTIEYSGLDGAVYLISTGTVDPNGVFALATPVPPGGIACSYQTSVDGWVVDTGSFECPQGAPESPPLIGTATFDDRIVTVTAPPGTTTGGVLSFEVCASSGGEPLVAFPGFISTGRDRSGPLGTHSTGLLGPDGCYSGSVIVADGPGSIPIFTSNGPDVEQVLEIEVTDPPAFAPPIALPESTTTTQAATTTTVASSTDDATSDDATSDDGDSATADDTPTDGVSADDDSATLDDTSDDEGGGFPVWIPILVIGGIAIGGGFWLFRSRLGGSSTASDAPDDVSMSDLAQYADRELSTTTDVYTGVIIGSRDTTTASPPPFDDLWIALLDEEDQIQERYLEDYRSLLDEVGRAYEQFRSAIGIFHEKFLKVASGSTELQGYLQRWRENQQTAKKQDIAFAVITIVWGIGKLGVSGAKWIAARGTDEAAEGATAVGNLIGGADELATADTMLGGAVTVLDEGRDLTHIARRLSDKYLDEIGMTWDDWVRLNRYDLDRATTALLQAVARSRGWITMTDDAAAVIQRLLINGRLAAAGRGTTIDPTDLARLAEWANTPGFWDKLLLACVEMDQEIALLFAADDVKFLRALLASKGDAAALRPLIGPAQETALTVAAEVVSDIPSLSGLTYSGGKLMFDSANLGKSVATYGQTAERTDDLDLGSYTDQFGEWATSWNDGLGWFVLDNLWGMFTSPFEWFSGILHTAGAMDRYADFLEGSRDDLLGLGSSLGDAIDALRDLHGAIDRADLDDPTSSLGGSRAAELRGVLSRMDDLVAGSPSEWRAQHVEQLEERRAHIEQKIAQIEATLRALHEQLALLAQLADQLDAARRNPDGSLRDVVDLWNPGLLAGLASIDITLRSLIGNALFGASQPLVSVSNGTGGTPDPWAGTDDLVEPDSDLFDWGPELDEVFVRPQ